MFSDRPGKLVTENIAACRRAGGTTLNVPAPAEEEDRGRELQRARGAGALQRARPDPPRATWTSCSRRTSSCSARPEYQPWFRRWFVHGGDKYLEAKLGTLPPLESAEERGEKVVASFTAEMRLKSQAHLNQ